MNEDNLEELRAKIYANLALIIDKMGKDINTIAKRFMDQSALISEEESKHFNSVEDLIKTIPGIKPID